MKSATRHMLLLAGMLCLWASAYTLGRSDAHERATTSHRPASAPGTNLRADLRGTASDALGSGIAVSGVGIDLATRTATSPPFRPEAGGHARGQGAPAAARPRSGPG